MKAGGRPLYEVTDGNVGRVIDMRWLTTQAARFRLVGVVNRLDRRDFADPATADAARSASSTGSPMPSRRRARLLASRLPVDFNAVYSVAPDADGGCTGVAGRWRPQLDEAVDAGWLAGGPIDPSDLTFKQLELNAQMVRFPSGQETEFGGQAAYLMRVFGIDGDAVTEKAAGEHARQCAARRRCGAEDAAGRLRQRQRAGDRPRRLRGSGGIPGEEGHLLVDLRQRAPRQPSVHARRCSRRTISPVSISRRCSLVKSPNAMIERLDNGTCQGCHQAGSTAGFHFIGRDDKRRRRSTASRSASRRISMPSRSAARPISRAVVEGREPTEFRPLSFAPPADWSADAPQYEPAGAGNACVAAENAARFRRRLGVRGGHGLHADRHATGTRMELANACCRRRARTMFSGHPCLTGEIASTRASPSTTA